MVACIAVKRLVTLTFMSFRRSRPQFCHDDGTIDKKLTRCPALNKRLNRLQ
jgi:hypothetical protein